MKFEDLEVALTNLLDDIDERPVISFLKEISKCPSATIRDVLKKSYLKTVFRGAETNTKMSYLLCCVIGLVPFIAIVYLIKSVSNNLHLHKSNCDSYRVSLGKFFVVSVHINDESPTDGATGRHENNDHENCLALTLFTKLSHL